MFHENRIQTNVSEVQKEYALGKRNFDKYDIEDNWNCFNGLIFDYANFTNCFIEACFSSCSFKNSVFLNCNLKTVRFEGCNLSDSTIEECSVESIDFTDSLLDGIKFGVNYAYGAILNANDLNREYLLNSFYKWILDKKEQLITKGIHIEEESCNTDCPLPFVKAIFTSEQYMGQVCLYENKFMDLEVINSDNFSLENSKLDFYEHLEVELNSDWNALLANFFRFMAQL